jgi:hypothetical protein
MLAPVSQGGWACDKWEGEGTLTYKNGEVIRGQFSGGRPHGIAKRSFENGDEYEGEFSAGVVSGHGNKAPKTRIPGQCPAERTCREFSIKAQMPSDLDPQP